MTTDIAIAIIVVNAIAAVLVRRRLLGLRLNAELRIWGNQRQPVKYSEDAAA